MSTTYLNSQTLPSARPPIKDTDPLFKNTPAEGYDLNSIIPVPINPLEAELVRVEPLITVWYAQLYETSILPDSDVRHSATKRETYVYLEKQRRRPNVLHFAIMNKKSRELAGTYPLGCSPDQATLDVRVMSVKLFPQFRGTYVLYHAMYLLLSHVLNLTSEGGCGFVRCAWRNSVANPRSARVPEKMGFTLEGPMRCYEVSDAYEGHPYEHFQVAADRTGRLIEDATIYSMTHFDWLRDGKKQRLEEICAKWT
ncbi:hypothetical protein FRC07_002000 [Ceratobasidium sp. 392]|nr:hypothetical protein FRC07_002000 [Ceratobasidium sp. 392]